MTNEQLQAENERLGAEVAALRTLLAAVRDLAEVPRAADPTIDADWNAYLALCDSRLGSIAAWADPDNGDSPASADTLHNSAGKLRELAALPLRYAPKAAALSDDTWRLTAKGAEVANAVAFPCCGHCEHPEASGDAEEHRLPCPDCRDAADAQKASQ